MGKAPGKLTKYETNGLKKTPGKCSIPLIKIKAQYFIFKKIFFFSFPNTQEKPRGPNLCWACKRSTAFLQGHLATCVPWLEIVNTLYPSNSLSWKFFPRRLWLMPTDVLVQRCSVFVTCKKWEPAWHPARLYSMKMFAFGCVGSLFLCKGFL